MGVQFGGYLCVDPMPIWEACREQGLPVDWIGKPNSMTIPLGMCPGQGWILLALSDFRQLTVNTLYNLVFNLPSSDITEPALAQTVTLKNLLIVKATTITPGVEPPSGTGIDPDHDAAVLVELADRRYIYVRFSPPMNKAYNIRSGTGSTDYYSGTMNGGSAWTWTTMLTDIWNAVGTLGSFPALPTTPDGTPEGYSFWGVSSWVVLAHVLRELKYALKLDPTTDTFTLVSLGASDSTESTAETTWEPYAVWDTDPTVSAKSIDPVNVRVHFPKYPPPTTPDTSPWYTVDKTDTAALSGTQSGSYDILFDELYALYDTTNTLTNSSTLDSRAAARASSYFTDRRKIWNAQINKTYGGPIQTTGLLPGAQLTATWWGDLGTGYKTQVIRKPLVEACVPEPSPPPVTPLPSPADKSIRVDINLVGPYNDYALPNVDLWIIKPSAQIKFTGFIAPGTNKTKKIEIKNAASAPAAGAAPATLWLVAGSALSAAANQIQTPDGNDIKVQPQETTELLYDSNTSKWQIGERQPQPNPLGLGLGIGVVLALPAIQILTTPRKYLRQDDTYQTVDSVQTSTGTPTLFTGEVYINTTDNTFNYSSDGVTAKPVVVAEKTYGDGTSSSSTNRVTGTFTGTGQNNDIVTLLNLSGKAMVGLVSITMTSISGGSSMYVRGIIKDYNGSDNIERFYYTISNTTTVGSIALSDNTVTLNGVTYQCPLQNLELFLSGDNGATIGYQAAWAITYG